MNVDGDWIGVPAGESRTVHAGTPYTSRNQEPVELINRHEPALEYERFFRRFHELVRDEGVSLHGAAR